MMANEFKKLTLTIDGGNAAFGDTPGEAMDEVKRILSKLMASELATFVDSAGKPLLWDSDSTPEINAPLVDRNGNTVGRIEVEYETTFDHDAEIDF